MAVIDFHNKTVIITGASAGVGAACSRRFASLGAKLVLVARGQQALSEIEQELSRKTEVLAVAMDVADSSACSRLFEQAEARFGAVHVLVNNAGLHRRGDVESRTPQDLVDMVDVDLRAPLQLTAEALPFIRRAGVGAIVMVGSLAGRAPLQGAATYAATKAGLRAFTYSLADELRGSNIAVGVVSPGPIDTGFIMDEIDEVEDIVYSQPMSSAEQVAEAVLKLAKGKTVEIAMPWFSGKLTTLSYLFPSLRRASRGLLYKMGRKNKEKYRNR
jgi:short-subunit dehydrogenase